MAQEATVSSTMSDADHQIAIELRDVDKSFGACHVLKQMSLAVRAGEVFVVLGPSGCGKSTLLRLITGLESPTRGSIWIDVRDQSRVPPHQRPIAVAPQSGGYYEHLTTLENIILASKLPSAEENRSWPAAKGPAFNQWLIDRLELADVLHQKPTELSGGQVKRMIIARALASQRSTWLLDEPLTHLNESLRHRVREMLLELHRQSHSTIVYVTHDSMEAMQMADRVAVIDNGVIQQMDTPTELYERPRSISVAQSLGLPMMEFFAVDETSFQVGIRPVDWRIVRMFVEDNSNGSFAKDIERTQSGLRWTARVVRGHFMGDRWWLKVESKASSGRLFKGTVTASIETMQSLPARTQQEINSMLEAHRVYVELSVANESVHNIDAR